jgi:hypothetical protein
MRTPKYYLVRSEWEHGFVSHSAVTGNRLEGELQFAKSLNYVKNVTQHEIEQHEYDNFWIGKFNPKNLQMPSSDSEGPSTEPEKPKKLKEPQNKPSLPKFSSLENFFDSSKKPKRK